MPSCPCSVAVCNNNYFEAKRTGRKVSFYTIPKDPKLRKLWIDACHRKDKFDPENARVCSDHFKNEDFIRDLRGELMGDSFKQNRILKPGSVPTLKLLPSTDSSPPTTNTARSKRTENRLQKEVVEQLLFENLGPSNTTQETLEQKCARPEEENTKLKQYLHDSTLKIKALEEKYAEPQANSKEEEQNLFDKIKDMFKGVLTKNQLEIIVNKKKFVEWTVDEMSIAFTLRYLSKRGYIFLRDTLKYPLPGLSSLRRWALNFNVTPGLLTNVIKIMQIAGLEMDVHSRQVVLQFDEMKVESTFEYDIKRDLIVGPFSNMQVVQARGVFSKWKQPLYVDFDCKITVGILETVIKALKDVNFDVVAIVSDCGGGNRGLWSFLGVDEDSPSFVSSSTGLEIFCFADAPHLLKLVRNWFLDTGFTLDSKSITTEKVRELIESKADEVCSVYKLTRNHIEVAKTRRQNVALAAQLMSHTTSTALKHYFPDCENALRTAEFIDLVDAWFNLFNSYSPSESLEIKKPYGINLKAQNDKLAEIKNMFRSLLCTGEKNLQIFQKAILLSIAALQKLFKHLENKLGVSYVLTHKINQDALENLFSMIRLQGGGNDHPSPMDALYRIRLIILGKTHGQLQLRTNYTSLNPENDENFLLISVFKTAEIEPLKDTSDVSGPRSQEQQAIDIDSDSTVSMPSPAKKIKTDLKSSTERDGLFYVAGLLGQKVQTRISGSWGPYLHNE